jgi:2-phospho-L-lactate guanylyltransferase
MWAVIPINSFEKTMTRLSKVLNSSQRVQLTKHLTDQMIDYLLKIDEIEKIVLLTNLTKWSRSFKNKNIVFQENNDELSLKENINLVCDWVYDQGARRMLYLSIDLPLACEEDLKSLINQHKEGMTLVEAKKDGGTNALIIDLPRYLSFQFGKNSLEKHLVEAEKFKVKTKILKMDGLSFDLDDIDDWNHLIGINKSFLENLN